MESIRSDEARNNLRKTPGPPEPQPLERKYLTATKCFGQVQIIQFFPHSRFLEIRSYEFEIDFECEFLTLNSL